METMRAENIGGKKMPEKNGTTGNGTLANLEKSSILLKIPTKQRSVEQ